eukprot:m.37651 g.37651  ORF g.37651 m.37651 type:complete len:71 (+) comp10147_c0_seq6:2841-3053(+)
MRVRAHLRHCSQTRPVRTLRAATTLIALSARDKLLSLYCSLRVEKENHLVLLFEIFEIYFPFRSIAIPLH